MENSKQVSLKLCNLFDDFLVEFQDDIKRIAGKFKKHFHLLSDDEIYSECNLHLLKGKEKILSTFSQDSDFTREQFKKIAYHYVKNEVVWSHYRVQNKSYNRRRLDGFVETEDGTKTTKGPLVKILKADQNLSIQVHPDDELAKKLENQPNGKSEC